MAIDISEKKGGKYQFKTKLFWNLLGFLLFLLLLFGLIKLYNYTLKSGVKETRVAIQEIENKRDKVLEKEMKNIMDIFKKVSPVLDSHTRSRKILDFVEKNTYEGVYFSGLNYNLKENNLSLNAFSGTASNLLMQMTVFNSNKNVQSVEMSSFSIGDKGVSIQMKINFSPSIVKF
ncbi:MAG: hypothetical protein PHI88_03360 [Candidatus Pacebacteria bacterium]|nr:hypothetical protein [Candidatus Paceibacterota bacterium]